MIGPIPVLPVMKSRKIIWAGHVEHMGQKKVAQWVMVGKPDGKNTLGRPRCGWENNFKMDF
jgi:hypothetical protein